MTAPSIGPTLWALAGLATAAIGFGGVAMIGLASGSPTAIDDWHPPCARSLGHAYVGLDVRPSTRDDLGRTFLLGLDRSPSNAELANEQLETAVAFARSRPITDGFGIFFVSDRSDRSSTPDFTIEAPTQSREAVADRLPCAPDCAPSSLFERACLRDVEQALASRTSAMQQDLGRDDERLVRERSERLQTWSTEVSNYWPEPGTSLVRFWFKIADLPTVRRNPRQVTVVLLSDLEEARSEDRQAVMAFERELTALDGACPERNPLPDSLAGVHAVLLQTVTDGVDATRWASTWEQMLRCRGLHAERFRYSPSIPLGDYLGTLQPPEA